MYVEQSQGSSCGGQGAIFLLINDRTTKRMTAQRSNSNSPQDTSNFNIRVTIQVQVLVPVLGARYWQRLTKKSELDMLPILILILFRTIFHRQQKVAPFIPQSSSDKSPSSSMSG